MLVCTIVYLAITSPEALFVTMLVYGGGSFYYYFRVIQAEQIRERRQPPGFGCWMF